MQLQAFMDKLMKSKEYMQKEYDTIGLELKMHPEHETFQGTKDEFDAIWDGLD